jgi:hypothetical protein
MTDLQLPAPGPEDRWFDLIESSDDPTSSGPYCRGSPSCSNQSFHVISEIFVQGGAVIIKRQPGVELAENVAAVLSDDEVVNKAAALGKVFTEFPDEVTKQIGGIGRVPADVENLDSYFGAHPWMAPAGWHAEKEGDKADERVEQHAEKLEVLMRHADNLHAQGVFQNRTDAAHWLLNTKAGQRHFHTFRFHKSTKDTTMSNDYASTIAKAINAGETPAGITANQLTKIWFEEVQHDRLPNETREQCFARHYEDPESRPMWDALDALNKHLPYEATRAYAKAIGPRTVGQGEYLAEMANTDPVDALGELNKLAAVEKARNPSLTKAAAFAKVYAENSELAQAERRQNRPAA